MTSPESISIDEEPPDPIFNPKRDILKVKNLHRLCTTGTLDEFTCLLDDFDYEIDKEDIQSLRRTAAKEQSNEILTFLFTKYPQFRLEDTTIMSAIASNSISTFKILMKIDPEIAKRLPQNTGWSLGWVIHDKVSVEFIEFLIKNGADLEESGHWPPCIWLAAAQYDTPEVLFAATWANHLEIVKYLLEHGLRPEDDMDGFGSEPALNTAVERGFRDIAELLLEYGADPCLTNDKGESAFDIARKNNVEMLQMLQEWVGRREKD